MSIIGEVKLRHSNHFPDFQSLATNCQHLTKSQKGPSLSWIYSPHSLFVFKFIYNKTFLVLRQEKVKQRTMHDCALLASKQVVYSNTTTLIP